MSESLSISIAQMNIVPGDPAANLRRLTQMVADAADRGAQLLVCPELWSTGYVLERARELADEPGSGMFAELAGLARRHRIHILGSLLEREGAGVYNSAVCFTPEGELAGLYRKIHLFGLLDEDVWLAPGREPLCLDLPWGPTGVAICYDLRFPELFRGYAVGGARLIVLPAEWPMARVAHWRTLLQARAIENQCVIVACNAAGQTGDLVLGGHSMIIDSWGGILAEGGAEAQLLGATVDLAQVDETRRRIPVFADRRPEVYSTQVEGLVMADQP